ncbi:MAG: hypothetical protein WCO58_01585 [bacterium]
MKKIGGGWQYSVYDLENGRVIKKPNTFWQAYWTIFFYRFPKNVFHTDRRICRINADAQKSLVFLKTLLSIIGSEFGNPIIHDDYSYEQDKVVPVKTYFKIHSFEENKKIVDQYIAQVFLFWSYGFGERPFKLTNNYGVTKEGKLVFFDLGELYFTKEKAYERVASRHWDRTPISDSKLQKYYIGQMDKNYTIENIEKYWKK